ncbi:MAG: phage head closure protein [Chloroflexota bacterium]
MRAGRMRHRLAIQAKAAAPDAYGQEVIDWQDVAIVWGSVEPISGRELVELRQELGEVTTRIRLRYRRDRLTPEMRIYWSVHDIYYDIASVTNTGERNRETVIIAQEVVGHEQR